MTKIENTEMKIDSEDMTDDSVANKNKARNKSEKKSTGNGFVYVLLFSFVGLATAAAYYFWNIQQNQSNLIQQQEAAIIELRNLFEKNSNDFMQKITAAEENSKQLVILSEKMQQAENISQQAISIVNRSQREWVLAEIDYLLRIAHQRIAVAKDIAGAIAALKGADDRLKELGDLNLFNIRKQLAKDIASLNVIHQADVNGISLALDQVIAYLPDLPFKSVKDEIKVQITEGDVPVDETTNAENKSFIDSVIETVKQIGDIKVHQNSIEAASNAEQKNGIEQLLRTYLLGARLAALRFNQIQFLHEINQAQEIVRLHYDSNDNRVIQLQQLLQDYSVLQLNPDLPELTKAWILLQTKIAQPSKPTIKTTVTKLVPKVSNDVSKKDKPKVMIKNMEPK